MVKKPVVQCLCLVVLPSSYPASRVTKDGEGREMGVAGSINLQQNATLSTQPISSFDWSPDKEGLAVCTSFDQQLRVLIVTRLKTIWGQVKAADEDFPTDSFLRTSELSLLVRSEEEKTTHENNNGMWNLWLNSNLHKGMVREEECVWVHLFALAANIVFKYWHLLNSLQIWYFESNCYCDW